MDLNFRPRGYWDTESPELLIGRIQGEQRRRRAKALLDAGHHAELQAFLDEGRLLEPALSDSDRIAWGSLHPSNLGGEYLPALEETEVEIGRVAMASVTGDVVSLRIRRRGETLLAAVVDEYGTEYRGDGRIFERPLSMAELVDLIDGADSLDEDGAPGGLVFSLLEDWYSQNPDGLESLTQAVTVSSAFYPELQRYYESRVDAWIRERRSTKTVGTLNEH